MLFRRLAPLVFLLAAACGDDGRVADEVRPIDRPHLLTITDRLYAHPTWRGVKVMRRVTVAPRDGELVLRPQRVHVWGWSHDAAGTRLDRYSGIHRAAQAVFMDGIAPFWAASRLSAEGLTVGYPLPDDELQPPSDMQASDADLPPSLDDTLAFAQTHVPDEILLAVMRAGAGEWASREVREVVLPVAGAPDGTLRLTCRSRAWWVLLHIDAAWHRIVDTATLTSAAWRARGFVRLRTDGAVESANLEIDVRQVDREGAEVTRARHLLEARTPKESEARREADDMARYLALYRADKGAFREVLHAETTSHAKEILTLLVPDTDWAGIRLTPGKSTEGSATPLDRLALAVRGLWGDGGTLLVTGTTPPPAEERAPAWRVPASLVTDEVRVERGAEGDLRALAYTLAAAASTARVDPERLGFRDGHLDLAWVDADALLAAADLAAAEAELLSEALLLAIDESLEISNFAQRHAALPVERGPAAGHTLRGGTRFLGKVHRYQDALGPWMRRGWEAFPYRTAALLTDEPTLSSALWERARQLAAHGALGALRSGAIGVLGAAADLPEGEALALASALADDALIRAPGGTLQVHRWRDEDAARRFAERAEARRGGGRIEQAGRDVAVIRGEVPDAEAWLEHLGFGE